MPAIDSDSLALRADENLRAFNCAWARACATGDIWQNDDIVAVTSGLPVRAYNQAFTWRVPADPVASFTAARQYLERHVPKSRLRALESFAIDDQLFASAGFVRDGGIPTLTLHPLDPPPPAPDVDIRAVADEAALAQLVSLLAETFEMPRDVIERVFPPPLLNDRAWRGYIAFAGGQAVATAQLYVSAGVAGIYYVGTLEAYRRRGLGEAVTWQPVRDGVAAGCDMAGLQASPEGQPVYERMGFKQTGYYRTYIPQEA
jgi:ribosomal protein S18 acetylase RimI-like enzyme